MDEAFDTISLYWEDVTAGMLLAMRPIPPVVLARKRLATRDLIDGEYEVAWFLIASADEVDVDGFEAFGLMPPIGDIATAQDLPFQAVVTHLASLLNRGALLLSPPSATAANGRYAIDLRNVPAMTSEQLDRQRQLDSATIAPTWVDRALGREGTA